MAPQGPGAHYDEAGMKEVAKETEELSLAFGKMKKYAEDKSTTPACFGNVGEQTNVGDAFEETWKALADSLGKAGSCASGLSRKVNEAFTNMHGQDETGSREIHESGKGMR